MGMLALQTEELCVNFGKRSVVHDLSIKVEEGCIYGFLGRNGAGKSTTIRVLLGLLRSFSGRVQIFGEDMARGGRHILREVGALVESPGFYDHLSGRDNLRIAQVLRGLPDASIVRALERVGLLGDADRKVGHYSLGMKQRLSLAWALIGNPRLLILDEPINGLDPAGVREVRELIRHLRDDDGVTVFLSSHILAEVQLVADKLGIIHDGRLVVEKETRELVEPDELSVKVRCSQPIKAQTRLSGLSWILSSNLEEDGSLIVSLPKAQTANLNRLLLTEGFDIREFSWIRKDLEDYFMELTEGEMTDATVAC